MLYDENKEQGFEHKYDCLLFDLDDTLYPLNSGLALEVRKNIEEYMVKKLGIGEDRVPELCLSLYRSYGTTMAGLKAIGYNFTPDDFHSFVHGRLPYESLKPDPVLRNLLLSLPIRKVIFTNGDKTHAARVLNRLGLEDCFEGIICFETLNPPDANDAKSVEPNGDLSSEIFDISSYCSDSSAHLELPKTSIICKPSEQSFEQVFKICDIDPEKTLFFDDSIRNLQTGKRLGLHTIWVGSSSGADGVDIALEHIHNIREALPELWKAEDEKSENTIYRQKVAIRTRA